MEATPQIPHKLTLNERSQLTVSGVSEVISFDETAVVLQTTLGQLQIMGKDLKLKSLSQDGGQMAVNGMVCGLSYEEPRPQGGWFSRLLR